MRRAIFFAAAFVAACGVASASPVPFIDHPPPLWPRGQVRGNGGSPPPSPSIPQFLFADSTGVGMTAACAGTAVTGTQGETITFTRASAGSCLKGGELTGIANGDLVDLTNDQPAIQPGNDGGSWLGLSVWESRTNHALYNKAYDNAAWGTLVSGAAAPIVTADYSTAPDNSATAERIQFPATGALAVSILYQTGGCPTSSPVAMSCFVRGLDGGGTIDIGLGDGASGYRGGPCSFTNTSWTRCYVEGMETTTGGVADFFFGSGSAALGGTPRNASDILVSRCQCEDGSTVSPSIPTAGSTVTRALETATASYTATGSSFSLGGVYAPASSYIQDYRPVVSVDFDGGTEVVLATLGAKDWGYFRSGGVSIPPLLAVNNMVSYVAQASSVSYSSASGLVFASDPSQYQSDAGSVTVGAGLATIYIGGLSDGGRANSTVKSVCADPSATMCLPSGSSPVACPASVAVSSRTALVGDSIMVGINGLHVADEMNSRLCSRSKRVDQFAVGGTTITNCNLQYMNNVKGNPYQVVATECGVNDLLGGTAAAAWPLMESFLDNMMRDGGYQLIVGNVGPCAGTSGCVTAEIDAFNAMEANWCADAGTRATCLDNNLLLSSTLETGLYGPARTTWLANQCRVGSDKIHPNNFCTTILADTFADAVP